MEPALPHLEFGASVEEAELTVILMHGLGADGHDFADVASLLAQAASPGSRKGGARRGSATPSKRKAMS